MTNTADNNIPLLQYLPDRIRKNGSYRQDSINISPITESDMRSIKTYDNLGELQKIESTIDKWKPIPFHHNITFSINHLINKQLSIIQDFYQKMSHHRNIPISSVIRNQIQNLTTPINFSQIVITSNGQLSIPEI